MSILEKCEDKMTQELDVVNMLKGLRRTNNVILNVLSKNQKSMLKYQKTNILDSQSESSSSSDSGHSGNSSCSEIKSRKKKLEVKQSLQFKMMIDQALNKGLKQIDSFEPFSID